jgi:hypothetical protein
VAGARLNLVNTIDRAQVDGVDGKSVKGIGGKGGYVAARQALYNAVDAFGFGFRGVNAEDLGRQKRSPGACLCCVAELRTPNSA